MATENVNTTLGIAGLSPIFGDLEGSAVINLCDKDQSFIGANREVRHFIDQSFGIWDNLR